MAQMTDHDATNQEILEAVNASSHRVEERLRGIEQRLSTVESDVKDMRSSIHELNNTVVTKDYLNQKITEVIDNQNPKILDTNNKIAALATTLRHSGVLPEADARRIVSMEPYPRPL